MAAIALTAKNTAAENVAGPAHGSTKKEHQFSLDEVLGLSGKVAIVSGGSRSIGYACSHTLLSHNIAQLFIISRSQEALRRAMEPISSDLGDEKARKATWLQCDMGDRKVVADVAKKIRGQIGSIS